MSEVGVLGAGGMAREVAAFSSDSVSFFAVNKEYLENDNSLLIDIENPNDTLAQTPVVSAMGAPALRAAMLDSWPGNIYTNIIAESAELLTDQLGEGIIIAPGAIITTDTLIGNHVIVNVGATISHDCHLGDFVTVSPGAHIAGGVTLGAGVFVGIGAIISNNVTVAEGSVIGAGTVVINDIQEPNSVVVGNPARLLRKQEGWLRHV